METPARHHSEKGMPTGVVVGSHGCCWCEPVRARGGRGGAGGRSEMGSVSTWSDQGSEGGDEEG
jgi:hypothetical protein